MKKKFVSGGGAFAIIMTLMSLVVVSQSMQYAYAVEGGREVEEETGTAEAEPMETPEEEGEAPGKRLMKKFALKTNETKEIPRCIVEDGIGYVLDETSIVVRESGTGSSEGADVVKFSRKVEDLSDNDLARIAKTAEQDGMTGELLNVVYTVEEKDENGIPVRYSALCEYGGLKKYSVSYPTDWEMTAWYDPYETNQGRDDETIREEYIYVRIPLESEERKTVSGEPESEETPLAKPEIKDIPAKPESEENVTMPDIAVPLAAAVAAVAGGTLPFIIWFLILTVPVYAWKKKEKYRYIGQIRLKKAEGMYTAYLTKRLSARAEIPVFMIKLPKRVRKKAGDKMQIYCPNGKRILAEIDKNVIFTVEGD